MRFKASATPKLLTTTVLLALAFLLFTCAAAVPAAAQSDSILINEVMYDPEGSDYGNEWLELVNISGNDIDLKGWTIDIAGIYFIQKATLPPFIVAPGEYIVIGERNVEFTDIQVTSLSLQNGGTATDAIRLKDNESAIIDAVFYDFPNENELRDENGDIAESPALDAPTGNSLARIHLNDTDDYLADFLDTSIPTPGSKNSFPPYAELELDESVYINTPITLDSPDTFDHDGQIVEYEWTILNPDEDRETYNDQTPVHTFTSLGTHIITLVVTDNDGNTATAETETEVIEDPDDPILTMIDILKTLPENSKVTIHATITAAPGTIFDREGYAQDETGGIRLKYPSGIKVSTDTTYFISGHTDTVYGEPRIQIDDIRPTDQTVHIEPLEIDSGKISIEHRGMLISTSVIPVSKRDRYYYGEDNEQQISSTIYVPEMLDIELYPTTELESISVTGIVSQYGTDNDGKPKLRIIPTNARGIKFNQPASLSETAPETLARTGTTALPISLVFILNLLSLLTLAVRRYHSS